MVLACVQLDLSLFDKILEHTDSILIHCYDEQRRTLALDRKIRWCRYV